MFYKKKTSLKTRIHVLRLCLLISLEKYLDNFNNQNTFDYILELPPLIISDPGKREQLNLQSYMMVFQKQLVTSCRHLKNITSSYN